MLRPEDLSYIIFPGHNVKTLYESKVSSKWMALYNQFYEVWQVSWEQTLNELKSACALQNNDFLRQTVLSGLFYESQFVALQTNTFFDLRTKAHTTNPYFNLFPTSFWDEMKKEKADHVMTIEYLYVTPAWRKSLQGISLGEVLSCLAINLMLCTKCQSMVAVPRADRKVNTMIYSRGAQPIKQDIELHNVKVDLVRFPRQPWIRKNESETDVLIDYYWDNRLDLSEITADEEPALKKILA